jgi:hypothetical protein
MIGCKRLPDNGLERKPRPDGKKRDVWGRNSVTGTHTGSEEDI